MVYCDIPQFNLSLIDSYAFPMFHYYNGVISL